MQKREKSFTSAGFTMTELAVIIAIISVISMVAIPNFLKYPPKMRLNGATRVLASDLMAARMEAVKLNRQVYLEYASAKTYQVADTSGVLRSKTLADEYKDVEIASDFGKIIFDSRGASTGTNTISLTNIAGSRNININLAGRVNIQ